MIWRLFPLTDEEKRILSGEEQEEKSPDVGTGGLFGGINISSIPEVAEARERIERSRHGSPLTFPRTPSPSTRVPRAQDYQPTRCWRTCRNRLNPSKAPSG